MCGRFVQRYTWDSIQDFYELPDGPARNLQAHYNIAPTDAVEASGYYEWLKRPDGRQPYFISAADGGVLSFAGLWD
jgi:putative SOS response-associated peptidase YedK